MISNETEKMIQGEEKSLIPKGTPFTRCLASQKPPSGLTVTPGAVVGTVSSQQEGHGFESWVGSSLWGGCTLSPRKTCTLVFAVSVTAPLAGTGSTPSLHRPAPVDPECRVSSDRQIVGIFVHVREPGDTGVRRNQPNTFIFDVVSLCSVHAAVDQSKAAKSRVEGNHVFFW